MLRYLLHCFGIFPFLALKPYTYIFGHDAGCKLLSSQITQHVNAIFVRPRSLKIGFWQLPVFTHDNVVMLFNVYQKRAFQRKMYQKPLTCAEQDDYPRFTYSTFTLRKILFTSPVHSACFSTDKQLFIRTAFTR